MRRARERTVKRIVVGTLILVALLGACRRSRPAAQPAPVAEAVAPDTETQKIYVEAVMLRIPRDELHDLPPTLSELAARPYGTVLSAPHVLLEAGHPSRFEAPLDSDARTSFSWRLDARELADGTVQLGVGVTRREPDEEVSTTLVLSSGQVAILPTLFTAPEEKVLVLVLQPEVIRTEDDLERILDEKRELAESERRGESVD